ncbi:MAG TPA: hypothetical protein VNN72_03070 [Polyangiaceae bacterium]|nr:hypothetical protein [Polyangiaceae bacterium]
MTSAFHVTLASALLLTTGCVGTTGGDTFSFEAFGRGTGTGTADSPAVTGLGYTLALTRAKVHVGALYLNRVTPTSVSSDTTCTLPGVYVAEVPFALELDALSTERQPFPSLGQATADLAEAGEVWLTGGDVNDPSDSTIILDVAGLAERDGARFPFEGTLTIGENRLEPTPPELPGLKPICKERIVSPVPAHVTPERGLALVLSVDAARMFSNVEFSELAADANGLYHFDDDPSTATPASENLYIGLRAATGIYDFGFEP